MHPKRLLNPCQILKKRSRAFLPHGRGRYGGAVLRCFADIPEAEMPQIIYETAAKQRNTLRRCDQRVLKQLSAEIDDRLAVVEEWRENYK